MSVFEKYVPAAMAFLASGYNPDMEPAILKRCLYILLELSEAGQKLEAENNTLRERIRELEIVEESLGRNIADTAFCPLCLLKDCPQYHKGDLGMGAFDPESVDREQCKKSILAHAEKGAKEFVNGQRTS